MERIYVQWKSTLSLGILYKLESPEDEQKMVVKFMPLQNLKLSVIKLGSEER